MGTDTETTNGGVVLEGDNKVEGLDEMGGENQNQNQIIIRRKKERWIK